MVPDDDNNVSSNAVAVIGQCRVSVAAICRTSFSRFALIAGRIPVETFHIAHMTITTGLESFPTEPGIA